MATVDASENRPLLTSTDSASYGILSPNPSRGVADTDDEGIPGGRYTPDRRDKGDSSGGRYTPVGKSFSKTADLKPKPVWQVPLKDYDSLDYDICYNIPYKNMLCGYTKTTYRHMEALRWILVCIIGLLTGLVAFMIDFCVKELFSLKYGLFQKVLDTASPDNRVILAFLVLMAFDVVFAIIAGSLIAYKPVAGGSGIPEVMCYLNGVKVPHMTQLGTLAAKTVGVLFSVTGGLLVGKQGPMIHCGAIIGAGIPQFRFQRLKIPYPYFRSDRDKRDFVSSGAAAGVAAAFGAPIGGLLFALEGGSSFWNQALTWRTLLCCFSATFILDFSISVVNGGIPFGFLASPGLANFGEFNQDEGRLWNIYHLIVFILMGAVGGLLGALFNSLNVNLTKYRMKYLSQRWCRKILEVILISMVTTTTIFILALLLGTCLLDSGEIGEKATNSSDYFCPEHAKHKHYNDMATLMFNSQDTAIKQLFHRTGAFTLPTLFIVFIVYFFVACWTSGAGISGGVFVPCLLIGAVYGRFLATTFSYLKLWQPIYFSWLTTLYPGTYSLIGAASFLGGVTRMTVSLTVILIETTNEIRYGLPIMITVMVAKWVGDYFNHGLYDTHILLKKTPFLEWESPRQLDKLIAEDVMNSSGSKLSFLYPITRVRSIERLLRTTVHSAFPVVTLVDAEDVPVFPKNIKSQHTPQLYTRASVLGVGGSRYSTEEPEHNVHVRIRNPIAEECENSSGNWGGQDVEEGDERGFTKTYIVGGQEETRLVFRGLILRHQLVMLLKRKVFFNEEDGPKSQRKIKHAELTYEYPHYSDVYSVTLTETERNMLMDLSVFMNPSPYTISKEAPLPQVFNLFRTMGLHHLPVMQESGIVVGIITRHDLTHEKLHEIRHRKKASRFPHSDVNDHECMECRPVC